MDITSDFHLSQQTAQAKKLQHTAAINTATGNTPTDSNLENIRAVGQNFESMFLSTMLQNMFDHLPTDGLMGGGSAEKIWRSMQVEEYGAMMAKNGGIGIAEAVERQLLSLQEVSK